MGGVLHTRSRLHTHIHKHTEYLRYHQPTGQELPSQAWLAVTSITATTMQRKTSGLQPSHRLVGSLSSVRSTAVEVSHYRTGRVVS
jgi:hypothetical protein